MDQHKLKLFSVSSVDEQKQEIKQLYNKVHFRAVGQNSCVATC